LLRGVRRQECGCVVVWVRGLAGAQFWAVDASKAIKQAIKQLGSLAAG
jgi:hypothetical protein